MDFRSALVAEIAAIEADMRANPDPRSIKLERLSGLLRLYDQNHAPRMPHTASVAPEEYPGLATVTQKPGSRLRLVRRSSVAREHLLGKIREMLQGQTTPVRTAEIFESLRSQGISIPGENPINNLSAMLSNSPLFMSHKRAGWTLAGLAQTESAGPSASDGPASTIDPERR